VEEFGLYVKKPTVIFIYSTNARVHILNSQEATHTWFIDIWYKWSIEQTRNSLFQLEYIKSEEMVTDSFMKPL
jgi:hypothetical protein